MKKKSMELRKIVNFLIICIFCKESDVIEISNSNCISKLLKSSNVTCDKTSDIKVATIDEISPGNLLLNGFRGRLEAENTTHYLNGTYLVKFHNTTIMIDDQVYVSREMSTVHVLPAILQPTPEGKLQRQHLSLEMLKEIHINNMDRIEILKTENNIYHASYGLFALPKAITSAYLLWKLYL